MGQWTAVLLAFTLTIVSKQSHADVKLPPSITSQEPRHLIDFTRSYTLTLPCSATGWPAPEYEWTRNGELLDLSTRHELTQGSGELTIREMMKEDEGYYQCAASNMWGTAFTPVTNLRQAVFTAIGGVPSNTVVSIDVDEGQPYSMKCSLNVYSYPEPSIYWQTAVGILLAQSPTSLQTTRRISLDEHGTLHFANIRIQDERDGDVYKCVLYNHITDLSAGGGYTTLKVRPIEDVPKLPPSLQYSTQSPHIALVGGSAALVCIFAGNPVPRSINWHRADNNDLPQGRFTKTEFDTKLEISNIQAEDKGTYVCTAEGPMGSMEHSIVLKVEKSPTFVSGCEPENHNATEGGDHTFYCKADAVPDANITWTVNGKPLGEEFATRRTLSTDGHSLTIKAVCRADCVGGEDLQVVQCNASNIHGYAFASAYLNVLRLTTMTVKPKDATIDAAQLQNTTGDTLVMFDCDADTDESTPIDVTWYFGDDNIIHSDGSTHVIMDNHTLMLNLSGLSVSEIYNNFKGNYTCYVTNKFSSASHIAQLIVKEPPPPHPEPTPVPLFIRYYYLFLVPVVVLLLLILCLCCCLYCRRNREHVYSVDEKERIWGNDPEKECADTGYQDYQRPVDMGTAQRSRPSLASQGKSMQGSMASLAEYEDEMGRFNEDGSFIGIYATNRRRGSHDSAL